MRRIETVIVGGGPAGAATACGLAASGREVVLVERAGAPHHKVCGEFLSIETQSQLRRLGVDPAALGAVGIDHMTVHEGARAVSTALPFQAMSLSRYRLDAALLGRAEQLGAELKTNVSVQSATPDGSEWMVRCDDGDTMRCDRLVLATGKWRLRGIEDTRDASLVGMKMHLRLSAQGRRALAGQVELSLLDGGYAGLELIEDGIANLCLVLPRSTVAAIGPGWPAMQHHLTTKLPVLAERFDGAEPLWDQPMAVVCPAGGHLHGEDRPGVYRVGDRLAHIPPFTGDGLAIALGSAALAVEHIKQGRSSAAYLAAARRLTGRSVRLASLLSAVAGSRTGRAVFMRAAARMPGVIGIIARRTRLPLAAS